MLRFVLFVLCFSPLVAQTMKEVEITSEPSHHLALENEYVRVFKVEVAAHASTLLHRHGHDYFFVNFGDSHISNEVAGKPPVEVHLSDGEVRFTEGNFAHVARNLSDQPFRNVAIELLQDEKLRQTRSRWPMEGGERTFPGVHSKVLLVRDAVRVLATELDPGATVPSHRHDQPHLLVAISDLDLRSDVEGRGPTRFTLKAGDVKWVPGGFTHTVTNMGSQPARLVTVEF
jgi:quercetin dioxygenase-like cupin family protein